MRELERLAGGPEKIPLVVHLPGFNEESVRQTPLLEIYLAGTRYRKALDTLVDEAASTRVRTEQIAAFKQQPLSLDGADAWLEALLEAPEGGLAAQLRGMQPPAVLDDLLGQGFIAGNLDERNLDALWAQVSTWTGMPSTWPDTILSKDFGQDAASTNTNADDIAFAASSWALCVEFVDDLRRPPVIDLLQGIRELPRPVVDRLSRTWPSICATGTRTSTSAPPTRPKPRSRMKSTLPARADLGKIDTFRFEEDKVLKAAIALLVDGSWDTAAEWSALRVDAKDGSGTFWLRRDPARKSAWQLIKDAARLGQAIAKAGDKLSAKAGLESALERYVEFGSAVDQAHRQLEQRRVALLYPQLPEFEDLRACLDSMRAAWRDWADAWGTRLQRALSQRGLPSRSLPADSGRSSTKSFAR